MKSLLLVVAAVVCTLSTVTTTQAQIPVRRAAPVVKGPISVENTSIAVGQIPGVFYGTNPGCRYFFEVKNNGPKTFSGKVEITFLSGTSARGAVDKSFDLTIAPGQKASVSIDSQTSPAIGNSGLYTGFSFTAFSVVSEGSESLSTNYDRL